MLSKAAQVCVASLCLAATSTTTTTEAFVVSSTALKGSTVAAAAAARGHHRGVSCARCNTSPVRPSPSSRVSAIMAGDNPAGSNGRRRTTLSSALRNRLLSRGGDELGGREDDAAGADGEVSMRRRVRGVMRRSFVGLATAVIIRASFNPQSASAVGLYRPRLGRGTATSRQLEEQEAKKQERIREQVQKEHEEKLGSAEEIYGEQAAPAAVSTAGEVVDQAGEATAERARATTGRTEIVSHISDESVAKICALPTPEAQERALQMLLKEDYPTVWRKLTTQQRAAITKLRVENKTFKAVSIGDMRKRGKRDLSPLGLTFSAFLFVTGMRASLRSMSNQRKRVKVESAKFDAEKDEFMDVDGEAEFDVDIMKELRDMKEKMAGPGDSYAKDTRAYNPDFAAAAGDEEEYDKKIKEALEGTGKAGKTNKGETRKVFTNEPTTGPTAASGDQDLMGGDDNAGADTSGGAASAAAEAKKQADAKRLEDLFNNSSIDEPEDDNADGRERLP
ncbi:unnamed protein product [Ectocarpus sp. 6 AP-2014]